jgi:hypothetical protein
MHVQLRRQYEDAVAASRMIDWRANDPGDPETAA